MILFWKTTIMVHFQIQRAPRSPTNINGGVMKGLTCSALTGVWLIRRRHGRGRRGARRVSRREVRGRDLVAIVVLPGPLRLRVLEVNGLGWNNGLSSLKSSPRRTGKGRYALEANLEQRSRHMKYYVSNTF